MRAQLRETNDSSLVAQLIWVAVAGTVGAIVFVSIQELSGLPQHIAEFMGAQIVRRGGYSESLAGLIGWGVHFGVAFSYAILFALVINLPSFPRTRAPRWGVAASLAVVLGWLATLMTAPAIGTTISVLAGQGIPGSLPGLNTSFGLPFWTHVAFFASCFLVLVVIHDLLGGRVPSLNPRTINLDQQRGTPMSSKSFLIAIVMSMAVMTGTAQAQSPADLNDLEIAHVAYTVDLSDIRYAHLALAISKNPTVRVFAGTMIRDHNAVNDKALALVEKLGVAPQDNFLSQQLSDQSDELVDEMRQLSGAAFDRRYAENEVSYHKAANGLVEGTFIPNIENPEVKALFEQALVIFKVHEENAEKMAAAVESPTNVAETPSQ